MTYDTDADFQTIGDTMRAYTLTLFAALENPRHQANNLSHAEVAFAEVLGQTKIPFFQQAQAGPYWLDFYIPESSLAVEIDGDAYHQDKDKDKRRDEALLELGLLEVLHLRAIHVFSEPRQCVDLVMERIMALTNNGKKIPENVLEWMTAKGLTPVSTLPDVERRELRTESYVPSGPVWDRACRRKKASEIIEPSPAQLHDAILVLHADGYGIPELHDEAQRIMDEASAADVFRLIG